MQDEQRLRDAEIAMERTQPDYDPELMAAVRLGIEVEAFLKTDVGTYVFNRAMQDLSAAIAGIMGEVDVGSDEARLAHMQARGIQTFLDWLNEALRDGKDAQHKLEHEHDQADIEPDGGQPSEY